MKILIACEESGTVRDAFIERGHNAESCDLLPGRGKYVKQHHQGDIDDMLSRGWDMVIAFPPCTHLAVAGARWFPAKRADGRQQQGIDFFNKFTMLPYPLVAIENPVGIMSTQYRKPDQIIQPYEYGDAFKKKTCLWLKQLPLLKPTNIVDPGEQVTYSSGRSMPKWYADAWSLNPEERSKVRSQTFQGVADAMADQWGSL
tara:strand:+ start:42 stop:644 length:603 start_codon:yes stop_codon:yes gene_type:complete